MKSKKKHLLFSVLVSAILFSCQHKSKENTPWIYLFDGKSLNGWTQLGGDANYKIRDNTIVGTTVHDSPNSFMVYDKIHGDFILELDYKGDSIINSGIQIRSNSKSYYNGGRVHGYQIKIDPSNRSWSAEIYDEDRIEWLNSLMDNPAAQKAFRQNEWNNFRIEAIGDTIKTWINKVPTAYLIDDKANKGFIGLQVHSIDKDKEAGTELIWKNIKILTDSLSKYSRRTPLKPVVTKNALGENETQQGWQMLWDGKTNKGWRGAKLNGFPEKGWEINDGELHVLSSGGRESRVGGDIITLKKYGDFELKLDFMITDGANSGIKYYVDPELNIGKGSSIGLEYQILDDNLHPDAKLGNHQGSRTVASLYDLIQADLGKPMNGPGQWNSVHIISKDNHVEHWLNDMKVLEYERKSPEYRKLVSESKYVNYPNFGELESGHILLQDHGDRVSFKNIKIKPTIKN